MSDKVLFCQKCLNPFVYSEYEQYRHAKENKTSPLYCPICQSLKTQEAKRPARSAFSTPASNASRSDAGWADVGGPARRIEGPAKPRARVV